MTRRTLWAMRSHGEGTLYPVRRRTKRGVSVRWVAQVSMPDGTRTSASSRDKAEARALLADLLRRKAEHVPPGARRLTLGQFLQRWLTDVRPNLAPATWRKHESIIRCHLIGDLGLLRLSELSVADVRRYLATAGLGLGAQSVRHHRATLRRALADAQREGLVTRNVAALAEPPRLPHRERTVLTADQVRALIEGTRGDRHHALWTLAATTGLREAEMLGLTWADVDLEGGRVHVRRTLHRGPDGWARRDTKTVKSRRTVPLPPVTIDALREHWRRQQAERAAAGRMGREGLVFTTEHGQPIHGTNLLPPFYRALARLGLPRVTIHDLRHGAATLLIRQGMSIEKVALMLGHSTPRITAEIYLHLKTEDIVEAADIMQGAVG